MSASQGGYRVFILVQTKPGHTEDVHIVPRMLRIEPHGPFDCGHGFQGTATKDHGPSQSDVAIGLVGIEGDSLLRLGDGCIQPDMKPTPTHAPFRSGLAPNGRSRRRPV